MIVASIGAALALWCIFTFATIGKGTPAPFDPPRRLVIRGLYRFMRNPMHIGAALALAGAALFYKSAPLLAYGGVFLLACHLFVITYDEPRLRRSFGADYEAYCQRISRWWPAARVAQYARSGRAPPISDSHRQLGLPGQNSCGTFSAIFNFAEVTRV